MRDARIVVDDLTVEQAKADREVEQVKTRRERDRNRMDTGQITNPKDLERMQHELVSLETPRWPRSPRPAVRRSTACPTT